jgi:hypothetical protein
MDCDPVSRVAVTYIGRDAELASLLLDWSAALETVSVSFQDFQSQQEEENGAELLETA